jgi:hypothetical protein
MAWPAWAISHLHNVFFSGAVNVPNGANLLSNTSGTLVGIVLSPVTWGWGPVVSTNVALTLAPAVSAWGCWVALRRFVDWKPAAVVGAFVYGYSAAIVTSLFFAHVSVTWLPVPPLLFAVLYDICVRQSRTARRNGIELAVLLVVQFLISPEVLVMCTLLAIPGLAVVIVTGRRQLRARIAEATRALVLGVGVAAVLLAYPAWFGLNGPQSVSGVLFAIAPLSGIPLSGFFSPGAYGSVLNYVRFGGYPGTLGPPPNYLGWGAGVGLALSLVFAYRRPVMWFSLLMAGVTSWLALGYFLLGGPHSLEHIWMPWRYLSELPVLKEILPDQFAPFISFFVAVVLALGLDALARRLTIRPGWKTGQVSAVTGVVTALVAVLALVPVFLTLDVPLKVGSTDIPSWVRQDAPKLAANSVVLTTPFAVSGSTAPMLWQAVDDMHFRLAGGGLKTPNAHGGPVGQGTPGSPRRILTDLSLLGNAQPLGTATEVSTIRRVLSDWRVTDVVIDGPSRDPVYAAGFFTEVIGQAPRFVHGAWVWRVPATLKPPALGASLYLCRLAASYPANRHNPMAMVDCVLKAAALRRSSAL